MTSTEKMNMIRRSTVVIDEANFKEIKSLKGLHYVKLDNRLGAEIDINEFSHHLMSLVGVNEVESLSIEYRSCLKTVEIIKAFPNLWTLRVAGHNIISLDGLEMFTKGRRIEISVDNKKRNIEKISVVPIQRLDLDYMKNADLEAIKNCRSLNWLEIAKSPSPDFGAWENVPLQYLKLWHYGKFTELCDMASVKTLERVMIGACGKFERFSGDNSNIKTLNIDGCSKFERFTDGNLNVETLWIVSCKKFDISSLELLQSLESLMINDCASEIALSALPSLPRLRSLQLWTCRVNYDIVDLKKKFPRLELFHPSEITAEQAISLSMNSADVIIKSNQKQYLNGICVREAAK